MGPNEVAIALAESFSRPLYQNIASIGPSRPGPTGKICVLLGSSSPEPRFSEQLFPEERIHSNLAGVAKKYVGI